MSPASRSRPPRSAGWRSCGSPPPSWRSTIDLAAGRHREVVGELERLVAEEPLRETLHRQRMLALYRSGRQADALEAYRDARTVLVERMGIEPGPELRRLHDAILRQDDALEAELTRARAVRRVRDATSRLTAERPALRAVEDDLAGSIVELQAGREAQSPRTASSSARSRAWPPSRSRTPVFFGRERLVAELVARLAGAPLTGIVGSSGSGKSSALRAGLLAALAPASCPAATAGRSPCCGPGAPAAGARGGDGGRLRRPAGRSPSTSSRRSSRPAATRASARRSPTRSSPAPRSARRALVLVAVRADFYGRCAAYPELSRWLGANHVLVGPMRRDELRRAIERPARRAGLEVEPALVDALLADVEGRPGRCRCCRPRCSSCGSTATGVACAWRPTSTPAACRARSPGSPSARTAGSTPSSVPWRAASYCAWRASGEGTRSCAGASRSTNSTARAAPTSLRVLAVDRLLTIGEGEVEVAHEALLREWPRLRGWFDEDVNGRRLHRQLREAPDVGAGTRSGRSLPRRTAGRGLDWAAAQDDELDAVQGGPPSVRAALRVSARANGGCGSAWPPSARCSSRSTVAGSSRSERGNARAAGDARRRPNGWAPARWRGRPRPSLLLHAAGVALDDSAETRANPLSALLRSRPRSV